MTKELTACLHGSDTCFEDPAIEMTEEQSAQSNGYALTNWSGTVISIYWWVLGARFSVN